MITILVYNPDTDAIETYRREAFEAMPYNRGGTLSVQEFRGVSNSTVLWTDKRFMETFNAFRSYYGSPIPAKFVFRRIWEGGHGDQSQHYAGGSFDTGQVFTAEQRAELHQSAVDFGRWSYVEPLEMTPTWVHFDKRLYPPACSAGYIMLKRGSKGVYVLILQDALNALGFTGSGLDGLFGSGTENAVRRFQRAKNLMQDGIVGCSTWRALTAEAKGIGETSTIVRP